MPRNKNTNANDYYSPFASRLRYLLDYTRKTQTELASAIGKTRQAVGYYADGTSGPDWQTLAAMADFFNVSVDYLVGRTDVLSPNNDLRSICEFTGLREDLVEKLHSLYEADHNDPNFMNTLYYTHEYELLYYRFQDYSTAAQLNELKKEVSKLIYESLYGSPSVMDCLDDKEVDIHIIHDHVLVNVLALLQDNDAIPASVQKMLIAENQLHSSMNRHNIQFFDIYRSTFTRSFDDILRRYESSLSGTFSNLILEDEIRAAIEHELSEYRSFLSELNNR